MGDVGFFHDKSTQILYKCALHFARIAFWAWFLYFFSEFYLCFTMLTPFQEDLFLSLSVFLFHKAKDIVLGVNGEIYNYITLQDSLEARRAALYLAMEITIS